MKSYAHLGMLFIGIAFSLSSHAQVALNGTAIHKPYAGLQPELVEGVSALPAIGRPLIRHAYLVDSQILVLTIDERAVILSNQKPYYREDGDTILMEGYHGESKILMRNGSRIAYICGKKNNFLRYFNTISGDKLDTRSLSDPASFIITSTSDNAYQNAVSPTNVFRKSQTIDRTHTSLKQQMPLRHELYLVLPSPLKNGNEYQIEIKDHHQFPASIRLHFDERALRSEAIHVNLLGYAPEDSKIAFLSTWMGDGGGYAYESLPEFSIINTKSNKSVFQGSAKMKKHGLTAEYILDETEYNHNNTDVLALDFSDFSEPGSYRIAVKGIGCSYEFEICEETWEQTARLLMKGFLHQRSGIELGPPYTDYQRPRNMHPGDETVINKCDVELFFNPPGFSEGTTQTGVFDRIQASILPDTDVPEAWGGWMDAGDFDQRMSHLWSVRRMIYLHDINSAYFSSLGLGIPESTNQIPDILDEGAWCLDLYRRTQGVYEAGGVSWWVESIEHPRGGEASWLNSLPTALVPPTPRASLLYAATAAQLSQALKNYDPSASEMYLQTALDAMQWVEDNPDAPDVFGSKSREVYEALAYLNLYIRTNNTSWHKKYLNSVESIFGKGRNINLNRGNYEVLVNYMLTSGIKKDKKLLERCETAFINYADDLLAGAAQTAYDILKPSAQELTRMATLGDMILPVIMAHQISGEQKYIDALVHTIQYTMGANPMNRSYISGLGERWFVPYQLDWESNNVAPPSGIPTFGPARQTSSKWGWWDKWAIEFIEDADLYPNDLNSWPHVEKCFNQAWMAPLNEFTVQSPMGELLLLSGYLAQLGK